MAITGIDTIDGKQIIAAGAVSAKSAEMAYNDENGNPITGYLTAVPDTYLQNSDLTITDGKVSEISGVPLSAGSTPTYDYTDNGLISSIDTSGLYATSAGTANNALWIPSGRRLDKAIEWNTLSDYGNGAQMVLNPSTTPFGITSGIYSPLFYATSAVITFGSSAGSAQYFGGFFKGNEWYVSNATAGQALRGETHASRGVHISGATTAGLGFDLSMNAVSGKNSVDGYNWKLERGCVSGKDSHGEWRYGYREDAALRAVSSCDMHESAFEYDANDKISGYNGSAFAGGSDVPEGVMVESGLEYNAVNEISAYNGSAIAQYGAEKQWLVHDDTIVHISNSAQYAFGCNVSALQRLMGIDETILYSGAATSTGNLNESIENFDTIKVNYLTDDGIQGVTEFMPNYSKIVTMDSMYIAQNSAVWFKATNYTFTANTSFSSYPYQLFKANNAITATWSNNTANTTFRITRVIGIGRKQ